MYICIYIFVSSFIFIYMHKYVQAASWLQVKAQYRDSQCTYMYKCVDTYTCITSKKKFMARVGSLKFGVCVRVCVYVCDTSLHSVM